ncbi:MAG: cysteine--tRNA ligase, partial [Lachnospiraceae bacterium]|nr:cysteine--tRNA ligase [Lachnospiraceae bacterium]
DFLTVSLLESKGYNPLVYRMFCLQSHYRKPLEFSYEVLDQVKAAYDKLRKRIAGLNAEKVGDSYKNVDKECFDKFNEDFMNALCSDINTAGALTVVYDVLKADINDDTKKALIDSFDYVLSLGLTEPYEDTQSEVDEELAAYVEEMLAKRKEAKKAKDFATADAIREELSAKGITIKDTREGTVWEINK